MGRRRFNGLFHNVAEVGIRVIDTNAWPWDRNKEFRLLPDTNTDFHLECPMSKCLGKNRGISYRDTLVEMVSNGEDHKVIRLTCGGYGGYNLTFHCDWYAVLDISITYR